MTLDFTLKKYEEICKLFSMLGIRTLKICEYLMSQADNAIIIRHDVDKNPKLALRMAELEKKYNITSSYYFRMKKGVFIPDIINEIAELGHEIGYHYEVVDKAEGDLEKAIEIFIKELKEFRTLYNVKTISMHGNPLSKNDNRIIWSKYDFRNYGIIGEVYLSIDYNKVIYLSDTCRTWSKNKPAITDFIPGSHTTQNYVPDIDSTNELIEFLKTNKRDVCLLVHPNRWNANWYEYMYQLMWDTMGTMVKKLIKRKK